LIYACSGNFEFPEGDVNYPINSDTSWTFCPDTTTIGGNAIYFTVDIDEFDITEGDTLFVFDGPDMNAAIIMELTTAASLIDFEISTGLTNYSGCLTFLFKSDSDVNTTSIGWNAEINCELKCQPIISSVMVDPPVSPADTGWVDICQGTMVDFSATASYPFQGSYFYPQSDSTSQFNWAFGDGSFAQEQNVSHSFENEGGYIVYLTVSNLLMEGSDTLLFCKNIEQSIIRVRVSTTPTFSGTYAINDPLCISATTELIGIAVPDSADFGASGLVAGQTFLPDGNGVSYETGIIITAFAPGQVLESMDQLLGVCANMEHSYSGDLSISITCPDGTSVLLKSFPSVTSSLLGEPNFDTIPGIGYDYCWSPTPAYQDMNTESLNYSTLPAGSYASVEPLSDLLGCPLNGQWILTVTDNLIADDGYIFYWSIAFDPSISPFYEVFSPEIVNMGWNEHESIIDVMSADTILIVGTEENPIDYTFWIEDNFGCFYDTTISLTVLPNPSLLIGDSACMNIDLEIEAEGSWEGGVWKLVYQENPEATVHISDTLVVDPIVTSNLPGLVKLIFDDEYCRTQDTLDLNFEPLPTVEVIADNSVCWGDTLWLSSSVSGPVSTYTWNTGEYDPDPHNPTTYIIGDVTLNYGVVVSGYCGDAEDYQKIDSRACFVETPNIITPNGDGVNDVFIIQWIEFFPGSSFNVYNRWGRKVFETDSYSNLEPWNADGVKDGVYFFTLILNDEYKRNATQNQYVKGSVTITRERPR
jgi:gliding motility-associated-like protein